MLPTQNEIHLPLILEIAKRGGKTGLSEKISGKTIVEVLAEYFNLSQADLDEEVSSGKNKWKNRVQFARKDLVNFGFLSNSIRDLWELTEMGMVVVKFLETHPFSIASIKKTLSKAEKDARKDIYEKMLANGVDKEKALDIAVGDNYKAILYLLERKS